jgi:hypothetical protein
MPAKRGQCDVCRYRWRLRKDGTVQVHYLYSGHDRAEEPCPGSGFLPRGTTPGECPACMAWLRENRFIVGACASVGISYNRSTGDMLRDFMNAFHARGHEEAA